MGDWSFVVAVAGDWAADSRIWLILGLIALNFVLAVAEALRTGAFEWVKLADFYSHDIIPKLIGYVALYVTLRVVTGTDSYLGEGAQWAAFGVLAASLVASIIGHLRGIYDTWNATPGAVE